MSSSNSGYFKMMCYNKMTKQFVGYMGTYGNDVSLVADEAEAVDVKWEPVDSDTYLAKETSPNDRYLGLAANDYAAWDLWGNKSSRQPVVLNADGTISLKNKPNIKLYGPYRYNGVDYACWTDQADNSNILVCKSDG